MDELVCPSETTSSNVHSCPLRTQPLKHVSRDKTVPNANALADVSMLPSHAPHLLFGTPTSQPSSRDVQCTTCRSVCICRMSVPWLMSQRSHHTPRTSFLMRRHSVWEAATGIHAMAVTTTLWGLGRNSRCQLLCSTMRTDRRKYTGPVQHTHVGRLSLSERVRPRRCTGDVRCSARSVLTHFFICRCWLHSTVSCGGTTRESTDTFKTLPLKVNQPSSVANPSTGWLSQRTGSCRVQLTGGSLTHIRTLTPLLSTSTIN